MRCGARRVSAPPLLTHAARGGCSLGECQLANRALPARGAAGYQKGKIWRVAGASTVPHGAHACAGSNGATAGAGTVEG